MLLVLVSAKGAKGLPKKFDFCFTDRGGVCVRCVGEYLVAVPLERGCKRGASSSCDVRSICLEVGKVVDIATVEETVRIGCIVCAPSLVCAACIPADQVAMAELTVELTTTANRSNTTDVATPDNDIAAGAAFPPEEPIRSLNFAIFSPDSASTTLVLLA
jgi:hypothetical protein